MVVPYSQKNLSLPHPAHEQAPITLKATVRNATCADGYDVVWDTNLNAAYDEPSSFYGRDAQNNLRDIGKFFRVPDVPRNQAMNIGVRVTPRCGDPATFGTFRLFVYDFTPSNDPTQWSNEQIEVMAAMGVQESLWWNHRKMHDFQHQDSSQLYGYIGNNGSSWGSQVTTRWASGLAMWNMQINGHPAAYPPGTYNAHGQSVPEGFFELNDERWATDPYAESSMRMINFLSDGAYTQGLGSIVEDEGRECGYQGPADNRTPIYCDRLDAAAGQVGDDTGAYISHVGNNNYGMGIMTGSLANVLPVLAGTVVQRSGASVQGKKWEWFVQQLVDMLARNQIDGFDAYSTGGWLYANCDGSGCWDDGADSDASTTQWAYIGLEGAEIAGRPYGVVVSNIHKYRIASNLIRNQHSEGSSRYRNNGAHHPHASIQLTGGAFVAARWLGINNMDNGSNNKPFPNETNYTESQLKNSYDRYVNYTRDNWNRASSNDHWMDNFWTGGHYLCGQANGVYNESNSVNFKCGNTYALYSHQKGYRTGSPEIDLIGGTKDWFREFNIYFIRAMNRNPSDYANFGTISEDACTGTGHKILCSYGTGFMPATMIGLVLTPALFNPKPVPIGSVSPSVVTEGCAGGNSGKVLFDHSDSFHPNSDSSIVFWRWDVNTDDGLWWETGAAPDFETDDPGQQDFEFAYPGTRPNEDSSVFSATLQVEDMEGQIKNSLVTVTVNQSGNLPPSAAHGGPYQIEQEDNLVLRGEATDGNNACGEVLTISWDLDGDGFDDGTGVNPTIAWANLGGLGVGADNPNTIRIRVQDDEGLEDIQSTTLIIYPRNPVADGRAQPNPARCEEQLSFDANGSFHPNPNRSLASYSWDFDGDGAFDDSGRTVDHAYPQFGTYDVTLQVTDDLGRTDTDAFQVVVDQGNQAPVARTDLAQYIALEGEVLVLDALSSSDPDAACGDGISLIEWDMNGNGSFADAVDISGNFSSGLPARRRGRIEIPWNDLVAYMQWPADRDTLLPNNTVNVRVTDTFGAQNEISVLVSLFEASPRPVVSQSPNPGMVSRDNGNGIVTLDGRESWSPVPGVAVTRYDWDLDNDGVFEVQDQPFIQFINIFNPVPEPENVPVVTITLRVTDDGGRHADLGYDVNFDVPPTAPTADADASDPPEEGYHILAGRGLSLNASQSMDPDDDDCVRYYRWDLAPEGAFVADFEADTGAGCDQPGKIMDLTAEDLAAHGLNVPGVYQARLQVEDNFNQSGEDDTEITVYPLNPTAVAVIDPNPASCGVRVNFGGGGSNHAHPDVNIMEWRWDLDGDGAFDDADGASVSLAYESFSFGGAISIGLQVVDSEGNLGEVREDLEVLAGNRPPMAQAGGYRVDGAVVGPYTIALGEDLNLDAAGSMDPDEPCGDSIQSYEWDVGNDGNFDGFVGEALVVSAAELEGLGLGIGTHEVRLRVTDRFGLTNDRAVTLNVVNGPEARAIASPARAGCSQLVEFSGEGSMTYGPVDEGFALVAYDWDTDGDGVYDDISGATFAQPVTAQPDENGHITVSATLRVKDASDRVDFQEVTVQIDVQNVQPVANAGGPYQTGPVNSNLEFTLVPGVALDEARVAGAFNNWSTEADPMVWDAVDGRWEASELLGPGDYTYKYYVRRQGQVDWEWWTDPNNARSVDDGHGGLNSIKLHASWAPVTLDGRGSSDPNEPCDSVSEYKWDLNLDGNYNDWDQDLYENFINDNWQVNTVHTVRLIVCDAQGVCSEPGESIIEVSNEAPPSGEVLEPRAGEAGCISAGNLPVRFNLSDPTGDIVTVTVVTGAVVLATVDIDTNDDGSARSEEIIVNTADIPEGMRELSLRLVDPKGGNSEINTGGRILFDRTDPEVTIGARPVAGTCYGQVQEPDLIVDDNLDDAPVSRQELVENGCGRLLRVTVTDACQNETVVERSYLLAQPPALEITGPDEGSLVANATLSWDAAQEGCAEIVGSEISVDNGARQNYAEGTVLNDGGSYALFLTAQDCNNGNEREFIRRFTVNGAPVAVPITANHPAQHPVLPQGYIVTEGSGLQLDGSASLSPEAGDSIVSYEWDLNNDGVFESQGELVAFDSSNNGTHDIALRVTDSLGLQDTQAFQVEVEDIDPVSDAGAPQQGTQGVEMTFDGSGSHSLSNADGLGLFEWDFDGDGEIDASGVGLENPSYTFTDDGTYETLLRVHDEDNFTEATVRITIADVDPIIEEIVPPVDVVEILPMTFGVTVNPGAPADPMTRYEWDFDNDGVFDNAEFAASEGREQSFQFRQPRTGDQHYVVSVTVHDQDSSSLQADIVNVREATFDELFGYIDTRLDKEIDAAEAPFDVMMANTLEPVHQILADGRWAERFERPGVAMFSAQRSIDRLSLAQDFGADFGLEIWALARQMKRSIERLKETILEAEAAPPANHPSLLRAQSYIDEVDRLFTPDFEEQVRNDGSLGVDLAREAVDAHYWLIHSIAPCNAYDGFPLPDISDPRARTAAAEPVNEQLSEAFTTLAQDFELYIAQGGVDDPAPARPRITSALAVLQQIRALMALNISVVCQEGQECITDEQALDLEILGAEIARDLNTAAVEGAWVREWQNCLVLGLKFRIELSMIRIEYVCGPRVALALNARDIQDTGLGFLNQQQDAQALDYYIHHDQQCLMVDVYNRCLAPSFEQNPWRSYPATCLNHQCAGDANCPDGTLCVAPDDANPDNLFCRYSCGADADCPERSSYCDLAEGFCRMGQILADDPRDGQCRTDNFCMPEEYCAIPNGLELGVCQAGCRVEPNNCPFGSLCDPELRECVEQ